MKAESKYKALVEEGEDLEKKKNDIEKKIHENQHDQQAQHAEIENLEQQLSLIKNKRKT